MQMNLIFCNTEDYFLNQIADFISRTQKEIQIMVYSDYEKAYEYIEKNHNQIEAVLADGVFFNKELPDKVTKILCSNYTELFPEDGFYQLNVFQRDEDLIRDLKKICLEQGVLQTVGDTEQVGKLISFFSIQGGSGQSTIAYQLAASLAQTYKILYYSSDFCNVYQTMYPVEHPTEISQLIFNSKDRQLHKDHFFQAIVRNQHGVYVLPPFQTIGDIVELKEEDIVFLLEQVQALHEFDFIFLDLNHQLDQLQQQLLSMSEKIISVYTTDFVGQQKQQKLQQDLYISKLRLLEKTEFVFNKSVQDTVIDIETVQFPYVQPSVDLFHSFYDHGNFRQSCLALKERIL